MVSTIHTSLLVWFSAINIFPFLYNNVLRCKSNIQVCLFRSHRYKNRKLLVICAEFVSYLIPGQVTGHCPSHKQFVESDFGLHYTWIHVVINTKRGNEGKLKTLCAFKPWHDGVDSMAQCHVVWLGYFIFALRKFQVLPTFGVMMTQFRYTTYQRPLWLVFRFVPDFFLVRYISVTSGFANGNLTKDERRTNEGVTEN